MDLAQYNRAANMEFPTDDVQTERFRNGAFGKDMTPEIRKDLFGDDNTNVAKGNNVQQSNIAVGNNQVNNQQVQQDNANNNLVNISPDELARLRSIDKMVQDGKLVDNGVQIETKNDNMDQVNQSSSNDQVANDDWLTKFESDFQMDETVVNTGNDTNVGIEPKVETVDNSTNENTTKGTMVLISEGIKKGISRDSMNEFLKGLTTEDYLELYKIKQMMKQGSDQVVSQNTGQANTNNTYTPVNFTRVKPSQGPTVNSLASAPTMVKSGTGVQKIYGMGARNALI